MQMINELITEADDASQLRMSLACLRRWTSKRRGPPFLKIGTLVRYRVDELGNWLQPVGGSADVEQNKRQANPLLEIEQKSALS
jgi:hypothetical protein